MRKFFLLSDSGHLDAAIALGPFTLSPSYLDPKPSFVLGLRPCRGEALSHPTPFAPLLWAAWKTRAPLLVRAVCLGQCQFPRQGKWDRSKPGS